MEIAIEEARLACANGEVPIGAVLVNSMTGKVFAKSGNRVERDFDPTAHAELIVIRRAAALLSKVRLNDFDLYVTLEPCPMCAGAISLARLRRVYFGAYDIKGGGIENGPRIFHQSTCTHRPEIYGGIRESDSAQLLRNFFLQRRS
tara:strand:+ start:214 stop:651 length:438 start_codon:yes stop_codon:yes gene_type:complete